MVLAALACLTCGKAQCMPTAKTLYRRTLAQNPDCFLAHNNLASLFSKGDAVDEAVAHWLKAVEVQPGNVETYRNLGVAALQKDRWMRRLPI